MTANLAEHHAACVHVDLRFSPKCAKVSALGCSGQAPRGTSSRLKTLVPGTT